MPTLNTGSSKQLNARRNTHQKDIKSVQFFKYQSEKNIYNHIDSTDLLLKKFT